MSTPALRMVVPGLDLLLCERLNHLLAELELRLHLRGLQCDGAHFQTLHAECASQNDTSETRSIESPTRSRDVSEEHTRKR